jgi:PAS domain S-box-containing protein
VLIVEDDPLDAEFVVAELVRSGIDPQWHRVDTEARFLERLEPALDVILSDFSLPAFGAFRALALLQQRDLDVPFIVVSGSIGEDTAVQLLKSGAADYLLKDRLGRLAQAVLRVVEQRQLQRERREVQARFQFAMEAARVGVWEIDYRTGAVAWSDRQARLHGLSPETFAGTLDAVGQCVHPDDRHTVQKAIDPAVIGGTDANLEYRTLWPDGTEHWLALRGRALGDPTARPTRAVGVCLDVTERHALESQYRQAQKMEAIGQLAGGIAHDFNNLLTAIDGFAALAADEIAPDHAAAADLVEIRLAAERAGRLTQQLLAFSRRQVLAPRIVDLRRVLLGIEPLLRRLISASIDIIIRVAPDPFGLVKADPGQIEQVILNLAVNARDAMPHGGTLTLEIAEVELDGAYVRRHPVATPGRHVMLAVTDTGTGMDTDTLGRIFDPFFTTKEFGRGTGLGLATVYGIIQQSGGNIWVYSEPGKGSTFKVYLPCVDAAADDTVPPAPAAQHRGSETILLVEDDDAVRTLATRVLQSRGYRVLIAASPQAALDLVAGSPERIDLVLTDIVLPKMDGRTLFERIATLRPDIASLFMSGYTPGVIVQQNVLDEGMAFIQKPMTPERLTQKVREVLDQAASRRPPQ